MPMGMRERTATIARVATSGLRRKSRYWAAKGCIGRGNPGLAIGVE